jgi:glycosyltransferase involved in cell wall biosynthesis
MILTQTPKIHIWIPDYQSATGGIQVFSNFLVRAIADCFPEGQITVLSKNDRSFPILPTHKGPIMFDCTGWWAPSHRTAAYTSQLIKYGLRDRPDLIFCGHVNFSPVARWLKRFAGIRFIAIGHGLDVWNIRREHVRRAVPVADRALAVSHFTANSMTKAFGLRHDQIGLLPNTFDPETFVPGLKPHYLLKRFRLAPEQPVILTVARLAGEERFKGYDQVLRALPAVRQVVPQVHYILGGKGPDKPRIEALIRDLRLDDAVTLAGYIPDHELCGFYNLCDVFAMPSKAEGFGIVFLEALACGKPVITGNKDGSVDAVMNGRLGVLVDPDNVAEIAEALMLVLTKRHPLRILQDPERLRAEGIAAYGYPRFVETLAVHLARFGFSPKVLATD